jgi:gliding motility-associated-like protein
LEASADTINISCFGKTDGAGIVYPSGGVGKYQVTWNTGVTGDTIRNLRVGRYTATVRDSNNCTVSTSIDVKEPPQIFIDQVSASAAKCFGDSSGTLTVAGRGGTAPYRYSLDGVRFQIDPTFKNIPAKIYTVTVRDSTGCRNTVPITVTQPPQLKVSAGADIEIILGKNGDLRSVVTPVNSQVSYVWTPKDSTINCSTCPDVMVRPFRNTTYRISVRDSAGCIAFDEVNVQVIKKRNIYIPNAFSPGIGKDKEGINDFFTLFGDEAALSIIELRVYNRWGNLVYDGKNLPLSAPERGWDGTWKGTPLAPDVFAFVAVVRFIDGEDVIYKGDITIVK